MTTLAEFRETVRDLGGFAANDTRLTDTVVSREINRGLKRIAMRHDWPWLQKERKVTLVGDQSDYTLPSDFLRLVSLRHTDSGEQLNLRSQAELDGYGVGSGRPTAYAIYGNKIRVARTPSLGTEDELTIKYICREETLVQDTDSALIPDYWEDGLYEAVLVQLHRIVKQIDEAGLAEARFQLWVTETQGNIGQNKAAPRVRARRGSWI